MPHLRVRIESVHYLNENLNVVCVLVNQIVGPLVHARIGCCCTSTLLAGVSGSELEATSRRRRHLYQLRVSLGKLCIRSSLEGARAFLSEDSSSWLADPSDILTDAHITAAIVLPVQSVPTFLFLFFLLF